MAIVKSKKLIKKKTSVPSYKTRKQQVTITKKNKNTKHVNRKFTLVWGGGG